MPWTALLLVAAMLRPTEPEESHGTGHHDRIGYREVGISVHGVDAEGMIVVRRRLTRTRLLEFFRKIGSCRVGIEGHTVHENFGHSGICD